MEELNTSSTSARAALWYVRALELACEDPGQCSTVCTDALALGELDMCLRPTTLEALIGCRGERLRWRRKCDWCLGQMLAGLHHCIMCPEAHSVQVLEVRRDALGATEAE